MNSLNDILAFFSIIDRLQILQVKPFKLSLSAQGLRSVVLTRRNTPFDFYVGPETYTVPSYIADFLSPKIGGLHKEDPTLDFYEVAAPDPSKFFPQFLTLGRGEDLEITQANLPFFAAFASELQNAEVKELLYQHFPPTSPAEDIYARVQILEAFGDDASGELHHISSHFSEMPGPVIDAISIDHLAIIASQSGFAVKDQDRFFEFLAARIDKDESSIRLLEYVDFTALNEASMRKFVEIGTRFLGSLNPRIWERIFERLKQAVNPPPNRNRAVK
jgi:hypothetical protein